jgi:hypothetical protein
MKRLTVYETCAVLLVTTVGVAAVLSARRPRQARAGVTDAKTERNMPVVLSRHLEKLRQAIPGNGGEPGEGPGRADEERFLALAYPDTDIPLARLDAARAAAASKAKKGFPTGKGRPGSWVTVGPSQALYPFTQFRNSYGYVPNTYVASGRATAIAIDPHCAPGNCRLWVYAAGGGVWRTKNALGGQPNWQFLSGGFGINSGSSIVLDPNDPTGNTLYVGTGEANASGDSAAGVGMYKSTDGGDTWTGPLGASVFNGRAIGSIAVKPGDPYTIYAATTRGVLGVSSVSGGGVSLIPGAAKWGLYKSTDGGQNWTFIHNGSTDASACTGDSTEASNAGPCSPRGVRRVALDPFNPDIVYAGSYSRGVWRSPDGGATWVQIKPRLGTSTTDTAMRPEIAVTALPNGKTRMYVYEGSSGSPTARLFRSDDVATGTPVFTNLSSSNPADPGYGTHNVCTGQCWYDNIVYTPAGHPDIVYVAGSYYYGESFSNKRALVMSTDAGVSATDMTMDGTDSLHPNGLHPDHHAMVTNPSNPYQFFEVGDGGAVRSSGEFTDVSWWCDGRGITNQARLDRCKQLLSRVPTKLESLNKGLATLQFQSLSVSPFNVNLLQGGTQDNGTWQTPGNPVKWENTMIGDGGQSGFDAANPDFRFHTFYYASPDVNFSKGDIADWNWIADPIYGTEPQSFYVPMIADPVVGKTLFVGTSHVWRTKTWGMGGAMTVSEFRQHCNEWFGDFTVVCGDWEPLGDPLTSSSYGDRSGGYVSAVERAPADTSTLWAATGTGRVFISKSADADPASAVAFIRLDSLVSNDPNRFVAGIHVDPVNPNHAWISYLGFSATTPSTPGHVFDVTYDQNTGTAAWVDVSYDLGDIPINDVVRDDVRGDLYAASDFGVYRLPAGAASWGLAAPGMPNAEVAGLVMRSAERKLYAATHGLSAWLLNLP